MLTKRNLTLFFFLVISITASVIFLHETQAVPFHPDESTRIFTSADFELFLQNPSYLFWNEESKNDLRQKYRELDAPLTNYLIGLSRQLVGMPPVAHDWDWSKNWHENERAGALPDTGLLLTSRLAVAALFPLSMTLLFITAFRVSNEFTALLSVVLFASNALVLLHTRRAMAEGLVVFTTIFTLWSLVTIEKRRWAIAFPVALAFAAKQSLAPLILLGLLASLWPAAMSPAKSRQGVLAQGLLYAIAVITFIFLLHPFVWGQPLKAITAAARARQELASNQVIDRPEQALNSPARKLVSLLGNLYINPPMTAETGNYLVETQAADSTYLANPLHSILRSPIGGAVLFIFTLFGAATSMLCAYKEKITAQRRRLALLLAATFLQTAALYLLIPLPWQRYYMPLVPYICLWAAFGIDQLRQALFKSIFIRRSGKRGDFCTPDHQR